MRLERRPGSLHARAVHAAATTAASLAADPKLGGPTGPEPHVVVGKGSHGKRRDEDRHTPSTERKTSERKRRGDGRQEEEQRETQKRKTQRRPPNVASSRMSGRHPRGVPALRVQASQKRPRDPQLAGLMSQETLRDQPRGLRIVRTCVPACTHTLSHTLVCTHAHTHIHTRIHTHPHMCSYAHIHTYMHTPDVCMHMFMYPHIHVRTCTHSRTDTGMHRVHTNANPHA